uniref:J domain-containing protein n=1 Tax=Callorhinchus milii TaxID=7868 RepID=A0A4W3GZQ4_CALMI
QLHPDIDPSNPDLHKKFVRLNEAYSVLSKSDSRRQYDNRLRLRQAEPFRETSGAQRDRGSDLNSRPGHGFEDEQQRYWEQFHQPSASQQAAFHSTQRRSRNLKVFGYCIFIMLAGVFVHYIGFR